MSPNENPNNAQPQPRPAAQTQPRPAAQTQVRPAAQPQARPAAQPQARPAAQTQTRPAAQPQVQPAAQTQPYPAAQTQPQPAAQTQPRPAAQTPTPPYAPYGPSPEPKLGERLNVQALVDFIKRPPVLIALLIVGAFCLGRCDGGDKNEVAQTPNVAIEDATVAYVAVAGTSNDVFAREFCDIFHRCTERVLKKADPNSEFVKKLKAQEGSTAHSALEKMQERGTIPVDEIFNFEDDPVHVTLPPFIIINNLLSDLILGDVSLRVIIRDEFRVVLDELHAINLGVYDLSPALENSFHHCLVSLKTFVEADPTAEELWEMLIALRVAPMFEEFFELLMQEVPNVSSYCAPRPITF